MIRIHKEGRIIVIVTLLGLIAMIIVVAWFLPYQFNYLATAIALVIMILIFRFFRVPHRRPFLDEKTIISPADGKVVAIERIQQGEYMNAACIQVSVFMSIHDVHINYFPVSGKVDYLKYSPGKYLVARHPKSSVLNERFSTGIMTPHGKLLVRQVAGYVARRIRCYARENENVEQGNELGFIKFGSRLDIFIPADAEIKVQLDQKVIGSVTPVARFK